MKTKRGLRPLFSPLNEPFKKAIDRVSNRSRQLKAIRKTVESLKKLDDILIFAVNMCHAFGFDACGLIDTKGFPKIHAAT